MNDTRIYLDGIFNGKIPVKRKNKQTGAMENIYYKYDDDLEDLIEIDRPSSSFYGLDEENQSIYPLQIDQYQNIFSEYIPETQELYPTLADQAAPMQNFAGKNVSTPQNNSYIDTIKFVNPYIPVMTDATLLLDSIERKKQKHYNRQRFVHPDLRQGNGRQILNNEADQWNCTENAIAHNLNGASGNMDCRGKIGTNREHQQMIVAPNGMIVNTPENMGTYDFVPPDDSIASHFANDVWPWIVWGNNEDDKTSAGERLGSALSGLFNAGMKKINRFWD